MIDERIKQVFGDYTYQLIFLQERVAYLEKQLEESKKETPNEG